MRIHGGAGRKPDRSPKKSFRLLFKSDHGPTDLEHRIFEDSDVDAFNTLVLRAGYNRTWVHYDGGGRNRAQYLREPFPGDTQRAMHLFLDGLYWGLYLLQERPDAAFQASYGGGDRADYDALNSGELVDGDLVAWAELLQRAGEDLSDPGAYAAVAELLEIDPFIDYILLNMTYGNVDWPEKNWWAGRDRAADGPFRFFTWDAELIFRYTYDDFTAVDAPESPGWLFQQLRANPEFLVRVGDRIQHHLFATGALTEDATMARWIATGDRVVPAVVGESARWGDHWRDARPPQPEPDNAAYLYTYSEHWLTESDYMQTYFIPTRYEKILPIYQDAGLFPWEEAPVLVPHGGSIDGGLLYTDPLQLSADTTVSARALVDGARWSALTRAEFVVTAR